MDARAGVMDHLRPEEPTVPAAGHAFDNVPNAELGSQIRDAISDLVADHSP